MRIIGDINREKIYTLAELEKKERIENVFATHCDILKLLEIDPSDRELRKYHILKVINKHNNICTRKKCTCALKSTRQVRYISIKNLIRKICGKQDIEKEQIVDISRTTALGKDFKNLILLVRKIVLFKEEALTTPVDFFVVWLTVNLSIIFIIFLERTYLSALISKLATSIV